MFYAWRPNLPNEARNQLSELAVAAQADAIVTRNLREPTLTNRLPDDRHERLKSLAKSNSISIKLDRSG